MTEWAPATEAEATMRDALRAEDQEQYFRILAGVELLLPVSAEALAGREPMGWGTWTASGRTHVLAFTSSEAMRSCLAEHASSARTMPYQELAAAWPNLDWWLAVNPGLPIEGYLPAWFVTQLARGDTRMPGRGANRQEAAATAEQTGRSEPWGRAAVPPTPTGASSRPGVAVPAQPGPVGPESHSDPAVDQAAAGIDSAGEVGAAAESTPSATAPEAEFGAGFTPANDLESQLLTAAAAGRIDHYLSTLLLAKVLLPSADDADPGLRPNAPGYQWRVEKLDGEPGVVVFTSAERLLEHLETEAPSHAIRFMQLIRTWPDESWSLSVNPGTPIGILLPGRQIAGLASSAAEVGLDDDAGEASETGADAANAAGARAVAQPVPMQKIVAPSQVSWYLERSYDRVSGFVQREGEVAHLRSPAKLVEGLGLRFEGSPFRPEDEEVYVLRWPAYRPSLYRIPYGGRSEAAMAAMEGWVIERPPFRGNGFAPSESEDVIAEFKVDSIRLPHGAQLWRLRADGTSQLVARLDADGPTWHRSEES